MRSAFNFKFIIKEHRFTKRYPLIIKCTPIHYNRFIECIIAIYCPYSMLTKYSSKIRRDSRCVKRTSDILWKSVLKLWRKISFLLQFGGGTPSIAVILPIKGQTQTSPLHHMWFIHMPAIVDCVSHSVLNATINDPRGDSRARFINKTGPWLLLAALPYSNPLLWTFVATVCAVIKGRCATISRYL